MVASPLRLVKNSKAYNQKAEEMTERILSVLPWTRKTISSPLIEWRDKIKMKNSLSYVRSTMKLTIYYLSGKDKSLEESVSSETFVLLQPYWQALSALWQWQLDLRVCGAKIFVQSFCLKYSLEGHVVSVTTVHFNQHGQWWWWLEGNRIGLIRRSNIYRKTVYRKSFYVTVRKILLDNHALLKVLRSWEFKLL